METLEQLNLTFTESVRLTKLTVKMGETELDAGFSPSGSASDVFAISLPKLQDGS